MPVRLSERAKSARAAFSDLLEELRIPLALSMQEIDRRAHWRPGTYRMLEAGRGVTRQKLRTLNRIMRLDDMNYRTVLEMADALHTSLDEAWLNTQPEYLRGGLMLAGCRERAEESQTQLSYRLGGLKVIQSMELGKERITDDHLNILVPFFQQINDALAPEERWFDAERADCFRRTCAAANEKVAERSREKARRERHPEAWAARQYRSKDGTDRSGGD